MGITRDKVLKLWLTHPNSGKDNKGRLWIRKEEDDTGRSYFECVKTKTKINSNNIYFVPPPEKP